MLTMVDVPPSQLNIQPAADINDQSYRFPYVKLDNALKYVLTASSSSVLVIFAHSAIFWSILKTWRLAGGGIKTTAKCSHSNETSPPISGLHALLHRQRLQPRNIAFTCAKIIALTPTPLPPPPTSR